MQSAQTQTLPFSSFISLSNPLRFVKLNAALSEWNIVNISLAQVAEQQFENSSKDKPNVLMTYEVYQC